MPHRQGWLRPPQAPPPPNDQNGWGRYVAVTLEHILVRLHYIERRQEDEANRHASDAPTTKDSTWADRKDLARDIGAAIKDTKTALMWIAVIILLGGLILKKLDLTQLQTLKSWLAMPG